MLSDNKSRDVIMPFRGFLNSCAADAKATVFKVESAFCFSNSYHYDMSLIVVIMNLVDDDPHYTSYENIYNFFLVVPNCPL